MLIGISHFFRFLHFLGSQGKSMHPMGVDMQGTYCASIKQCLGEQQAVVHWNRLITGCMPQKHRRGIFVHPAFQAEEVFTRPFAQIPNTLHMRIPSCTDDRVAQYRCIDLLQIHTMRMHRKACCQMTSSRKPHNIDRQVWKCLPEHTHSPTSLPQGQCPQVGSHRIGENRCTIVLCKKGITNRPHFPRRKPLVGTSRANQDHSLGLLCRLHRQRCLGEGTRILLH